MQIQNVTIKIDYTLLILKTDNLQRKSIYYGSSLILINEWSY